MTANLLPIIFILFAAFFKAVSDTLLHHYDASVFSRWSRKWWDPNVSWQYVKFLPLTTYRPDAWHLSNSGMIASFCLAFCLHQNFTHYWFEPILTFFLSVVLFVIVFNVFYNKILR